MLMQENRFVFPLGGPEDLVNKIGIALRAPLFDLKLKHVLLGARSLDFELRANKRAPLAGDVHPGGEFVGGYFGRIGASKRKRCAQNNCDEEEQRSWFHGGFGSRRS